MKKFLLAFLLGFAFCVQAASLQDTLNEATKAFQANDMDKASKLFTQVGDAVAKQNPQAAVQLWFNAAVANQKAGNFKEAEALARRAIAQKKAVSPENLPTYYEMVVFCEEQLGEHASKVKTLGEMESALKGNAKLLPSIISRKGDAYKDLELYNQAVATYKKALALAKKGTDKEFIARIYASLGLCLGQLGDYDGSFNALSESQKLADALKAPQTMADARSNTGILMTEQGDYAKSVEILNSALKIERDSKLRNKEGSDLNNLGQAYTAMSNYSGAMDLFSQALKIAREVKDRRLEGIAVENQALLYRFQGQYPDAIERYAQAQRIFQEVKFREGEASVLLGIGKLKEKDGAKYDEALDCYNKALQIYDELNILRGKDETLVQIANVYKLKGTPASTRATRDLTFTDEEEDSAADLAKAIDKSYEIASQAMELAQKLSNKELIWSCHQILGKAEYRKGNLEKAFDHYDKAIGIVTGMYNSLSAVQALGEFMAGKEDLYSEAQEVCSALYEKTNDEKYIALNMAYADTLRNEVQKASAGLSSLKFQDKEKQALFEKLNKLGKALAQAENAMPVKDDSAANAKKPSSEVATRLQYVDDEIKTQKARVAALGNDYQKVFDEWKKKYPGDSLYFDSSSRVDIASIKKSLSDGQAMLQYVTLPEKMLITVISNNRVSCVSVDVKKKVIDDLIKKDIAIDYINRRDNARSDRDLENVAHKLHILYGYLIDPVKDLIKDKNRLYIVSDGFLAQLPFSALVTEENGAKPTYLVEKYEIAYLRPSFVSNFASQKKGKPDKAMLAVANPHNIDFQMITLEGTIKEISKPYKLLTENNKAVDVGIELKKAGKGSFDPWLEKISNDEFSRAYPEFKELPNSPTEKWVKEHLAKYKYETLYFATHGMPASDVVISSTKTYPKQIDRLKKKLNFDSIPPFERSINFYGENLYGANPFNGFVYLSSENQNFNPKELNKKIDEQDDGILQIKEIANLPDSVFSATKNVILSACNTAVTYNPGALKMDFDVKEGEDKEIESMLRKQGWIPGADQVSLVDLFMRRGVQNVYGTFWFADDEASSDLMSDFSSNFFDPSNHMDAVSAFNAAQRKIVSAAKNDGKKYGSYSAMHPFFWAVGGMFGK